MTRAPKLFECDICHRLNERTALTDMWKADYGDERPEPLTICPAGGCWDEANKRGYLSRSQT